MILTGTYCFNEIGMVILGRYFFYLAAIILESVSSLSHSRDLNYYDGSRGRMDRNYEIHEEFFQRNSRPKRTPRGLNLWEKSPESQGVSCPTRLRDNYMGTAGDSDGMKEVVHIPCPKRKSSGAKVVAAFKGKNTKCNARKSQDGNRGARELLKNTRGNDLNQAVKQSAQWFIQSSQDRVQKPNQGYKDQSFNSSINTDLAGWNKNHPLLNSNPGVPTLNQPTIWKKPKGAKEELRKPHYIKSAQLAPADSKLKPNIKYPLSYVDAPQRLKEAVILERGQQSPAPTYQGYFNNGPFRNLQEVPNQGPYPKKDRLPQNPYEGNRLLMNSYNISHDGQHHYDPQNHPSNIFNPLNPSDRIAYPNPQAQMIPSFFQSHVIPVSDGAVQHYSYNVLYNVTMPSVTTKMLQNSNETRNEPWSPGAMVVDIPPGYPHQPKLPKITTRSFDAVNIKDLPKVDKKIPSSNSQFGYPNYDKGQQYQSFPNPHYESWKYRDGSNSNGQQQLNSNVARPEPPARSFEQLGVTPSIKKSSQPFKVFGKLKKEESKVKSAKPAKIPASNAHARIPVNGQGGHPAPFGGILMTNGKPDEPAPFLSHPELRPNLPNSQDRKDAGRFNTEVNTNYRAVIPIRKTSQDRSMSLNDRVYQEYRNFPGDMSHVLDPPVTLNANLYTNKAHKIASKFVSSKDVTYVPFRGVPPARNDEAFYDKNLNFLGKIDRPPLVNIKKRKWSKLNRRGNAGRIHADHPVDFYSEPIDFHSVSAKDAGPKYDKRHSRKCYPNLLNRQSFNPHSRIKV